MPRANTEPSAAPPASSDAVPGPQYLDASRVVSSMAVFGRGRVAELSAPRIVVLAVLAGGLITVGALFSVLLGTGVQVAGARKLIEGFAFSAGFFFVVLSEAVLFTEADVVLPATLLSDRRIWPRVLRFWALAWMGNLAGTWLFGNLIALAQMYPPDVLASLGATVDGKMAYQQLGGAENWWGVVVSGVLANWLVGMAAFFAFMGRTIVGKYVPVLLAVTLFVVAGFQHSPANMGFFALHIAHGGYLDWANALGWSIIPAGIGNMFGAATLVAIPYWYMFRRPLGPDQRSRRS